MARVTRPLHLHRAYGLVIASPLRLTGLATATDPSPVDVRVREVAGERVEDLDGESSARSADAQRVRLVWPGVGRALVVQGRDITVRREAGADETLLGACLAGSALAIALFQRGHLVLHASAVSLDEHVLAFAGPSGTGKSTLAAAFLARGAALVTDDVVCLEATGPVPLVQPAYPAMRLDTASSPVLGRDASPLGRLDAGGSGKEVFAVVERFEIARKPLHALFVVEDGEDLVVARKPPQQAAIDLVFNSYVATLLTGRTEADHFVRCADLATRLAVYTLRRPRRLDRLDDVVKAVSALTCRT
jgi:hypothetical protein